MQEKKYNLEFLHSFEKDLLKIKNYIVYNLDNPYAALKFNDLVEKAIFERLKNPEISEKYISLTTRSEVYYKIHVKNFTVFYVLKKDNVMEVRRIIYSKRNINKIM
jgi:plasmid stabilization system protein ParE